MATKTLYVGNLPYSTTESDLNAAFGNYGGTNSRIIEGRGFGFVDIDADMLDTAITEKNNSQMDGRTITVNEARPKGDNNRSGGGGGGGGYGGGKSRGGRW
jgi:cold-inducible RNA-binding protein